MKGVIRRLLILTLCISALSATASAYYYFLHFASRTGPFVPIPEKFDLSLLPSNTLYYFVSSAGPQKTSAGDSFTAILSELIRAGQTWNGIKTSDLRVAYGGLFSSATPQSTPHIEIVFAEVPPGLIAMGGPTSSANVVTPQSGAPFVPITKSLVVLQNDLSTQPSSSTGFFLTAVHELGHALGLQHTATSSVMSTDATRASTKASPLGVDDISAISVLYPNPLFIAGYGSISGQVTMSGSGVHLASVMAMTSIGQAVSALTNPDGTYQINGLAPGGYFVYVHPLPPSVQSDLGPSEIVLPLGPDGKSFPASDPFAAQFYPGTQDPLQQQMVTVKAGAMSSGVNFSVTPHAAPGLYGVSTYSFPGQQAVKPAYLNVNQRTTPIMVAWGTGLMNGNQPASGLNVSMLGNRILLAPGGAHPYPTDPTFLEVDLRFWPFTGLGPGHLIFSTPDDLYVLPSALTAVGRWPPAVAAAATAADADGNPVVTISGSEFSDTTRILFDGVRATVRSVDSVHGNIVVTPPPAPANYQTSIVALNGDGQTSLFLGSPVAYTYDWAPAATPSVSLSSASQTAGVEAMIEVTASNMTFVDGQTWVGFGSSDVVAKNVWVLSPTRLRADVFVAPGAQSSDTLVSVVSGFQTVSIPAGFHVVASSPGPASLGSDLANANPNQPAAFPGSMATLPVYNLPASATPASLTLTLNGVAVPVTNFDGTRFTFGIPATLATGPVIAQLQTGGAAVAPVFVTIQPAPPVIQSVSGNPAHQGEQLALTVLNLGYPGELVAPSRLELLINGVEYSVAGPVQTMQDHPEVHVVWTTLNSPIAPSDKASIILWLDGRPSAPFYIAAPK